MTGLNSAGGTTTGKASFKFKDGTVIDMKRPTVSIGGIISGDMVVNLTQSTILTDLKHEIYSETTYDPPSEKSFMGRMFSSYNTSLSDKIIV